tara:strand:+ start:629 stop:1558 length:930 start_codon:yes stop_codon:yes gene_type:complete
MFNNQLNAKNVKSAPKFVHFGKGQYFSIEVTEAPGSAEYFTLELMKPTASDKDAKKKQNLYFTLDSVGAAPAISGVIDVEVALLAAPTIPQTVAAIEALLEADTDIRWVKVNGSIITFQSKWHGKSADIVDGGTDFTFETTLEGFGGFLGATQDGVELSPEVEIEDVPADQVGGAPLTSLIKTSKHALKTKIIELSKERFNLLYGRVVGTVFTPSGGTEVMGFGTDKVGQSMANLTGELILLPLSFDNDTPDYEDAMFFFECSAVPGGLSMSNEVQSLEIDFKPYIDSSKDNRASYGVKGDGFQKELRL